MSEHYLELDGVKLGKGKQYVIILQGLPGSGKSTWAAVWADNVRTIGANPVVRVNKDLLREMLHFSVFSKQNEREVLAARDALVLDQLEAGNSVIIDDTNFETKHIDRVKELVKEVDDKIEVFVRFIDTPLLECLARNAGRTGKACVPDKVIREMYQRYIIPKLQKYVPAPNKPTAVVVDIDGTLTISGGRGPFEFGKVLNDEPNRNVIHLIRQLAIAGGDKIIIVSGRPDSCKDDTIAWLKMYDVPFDALHMRRTCDSRKDSIVKEEIYDAFILPEYNVRFVLDDRDQVVHHIREKFGLQVFQVAPGAF